MTHLILLPSSTSSDLKYKSYGEGPFCPPPPKVFKSLGKSPVEIGLKTLRFFYSPG